ncbi:MAG: HEPN domain-containing protein [Candidatus Latescibacterota bacterium]
MNEKARSWVLQTLHDLEIAEKVISVEGYDVAAFLSHQAVEKLLKALLAAREEEIPHIHYLDDLGRKLRLDKSIMNNLNKLSGDYTISRYPDASDLIP